MTALDELKERAEAIAKAKDAQYKREAEMIRHFKEEVASWNTSPTK